VQLDDEGTPTFEAEYQYDAAHNRTVKVIDGEATYYSYNAAKQLVSEISGGETTYYRYDGRGNTVAKQEPTGTTYFAYNGENLMTRIDFADGGHSYYSYDADSKRVDQRTADGFTQFVYRGPNILALQLERDEAGETQVHYTMGVGLEAMRRNSTSSFYHYNHLGTTLALTGADEAITDTYRHDAWGVLLSSTGATANPHTYVGRERYYRMPSADMYHLGFRDYAAGLGRFVTRDPTAADLASIDDDDHGVSHQHARIGGPAGRNANAVGGLVFTYACGRPTIVLDPDGAQCRISRLLGALRELLGLPCRVLDLLLRWGCTPTAGPADDQPSHPCYKMKHPHDPETPSIGSQPWKEACYSCCAWLYEEKRPGEPRLPERLLSECIHLCDHNTSPYDWLPHE